MKSLSERRDTDAVAKYRMPAQMSLVLREDVSDAKSPRSMHATFKEAPSRVAASSAIPHPVAYDSSKSIVSSQHGSIPQYIRVRVRGNITSWCPTVTVNQSSVSSLNIYIYIYT